MPLSNIIIKLDIFLLKHFKIIFIQNHTKFMLFFINKDMRPKIITSQNGPHRMFSPSVLKIKLKKVHS